MSVRQDTTMKLKALAEVAEKVEAALITTGSGTIAVELELRDPDRHSAVLEEIRASGPFSDLQTVATSLSNGLGELDEQLALLELEQTESRAIMRSAQPLVEEGAVEYWEAELTPGSVSIARYRKADEAPDRERQGVPMLHRSLSRLADELASALEETSS
jgi:hypothetical protein